jgi:two-component system, OmpR family, sensor kinase
MDRVPIRVRLTLAFTIVMAAVLAAAAAFLYVRLESGLDGAIDRGLHSRAADISALAQQADTGLRDSRQPNAGVAQVLSLNGSIVDATTGLTRRSLLTSSELVTAGRRPSFLTTTLTGEQLRLLAQPVQAQGRGLVVVVGASLEPRKQALADLRRQLFIGGPITLLLASLAGYLLAAAALRPVDAMSRRAASISAARPGGRLPVPRADDEVARLGDRLNAMLDRLEGALERERSLVSNASHELRTPLALMKTEIELALAEPPSVPVLAAALRSAGEETDRLAQLADDLLLLARIDSGALPLRRSPVPVAEMLEAIAVRFRTRASDQGREIEVRAPRSLTVLADRRRLEQALSNLVENALRHGKGKVVIEASAGTDPFELRVADQGPGFEPSFLARAFDRFSRVDTTSTTTGAGLGLAIVAAVAEAHGGHAEASNPPTGGALVTLALQREGPAAAGPPRPLYGSFVTRRRYRRGTSRSGRSPRPCPCRTSGGSAGPAAARGTGN